MRTLFFAALMLVASSVHGQVYRCGNSYSTTPCAGAKTINVRPQGNAGGDSGPSTKVYLCKAYNGQQFWSSNNCYQRGGSTLVREVSVPRDMKWDDQVATAQRAHREAESLSRVPDGSHSPPPSQDRRGQCEGIRQALAHNQSAQRAGGSGQWLDRLAAERRRLNDQRIAMRC